MEKRNIPFNKFYKQFNVLSLTLILISLFLLTFKGLNYGVDFKGGTLIELRSLDKTLSISDLRKSFNNLNLGIMLFFFRKVKSYHSQYFPNPYKKIIH